MQKPSDTTRIAVNESKTLKSDPRQSGSWSVYAPMYGELVFVRRSAQTCQCSWLTPRCDASTSILILMS